MSGKYLKYVLQRSFYLHISNDGILVSNLADLYTVEIEELDKTSQNAVNDIEYISTYSIVLHNVSICSLAQILLSLSIDKHNHNLHVSCG